MTSSARITAIAAFCKELREARAYQRITLREVSAMTRLGVDHLQAIEEARWDDVPRAYLRGYLSLYAQSVGMNVDKVLRSFDRLMIPESGPGSAVLDDAPPLLREPQAVGVTRAKIRTTWFAVLSRNRKLLYALSFLAVVGLLTLIFLTHKIEDRTAVGLLPFREALAESRMVLPTPLVVVPLDTASADLKSGQHWVQWIGTNPGTLILNRDRDTVRQWRFDAYDTIKIQYVDTVIARLAPAGSALAYVDTAIVSLDRLLRGDTALYRIGTHRPARRDSSESRRDSLVKG